MAEHPCMPFWTDAYLGDTRHLKTIEHGAYLLLLFTAWRSKNGSLPDDDNLLSRYTGLTLDKWRKIRPVLEPFFYIKSGQWFQGRLMDERKASLEFSKSQSKKAKDRHKKNETGFDKADFENLKSQSKNPSDKHLKNKETGDATAQPGQCPADASPSPSPSPIPKEKNTKKENSGFEEFWKQFPNQRKGNREKAAAAYRSALSRATAEEIATGLKRYLESNEVKVGMAKGTAAWLNDDRWTCGYDPPRAAPPRGQSAATNSENLKIMQELTGMRL